MTLKNDQTLFDLMAAFPRPGTLRQHGGITAAVLSSGTIRLGDTLTVTTFRQQAKPPSRRDPV